MTYTQYCLLIAAVAVVALAGMWIAWRKRARRDAGLAAPEGVLQGDVIASFPYASYVSTTPVGSPLVRAALPGLRYKGYAELLVRRDGVSIRVAGENEVAIPRTSLIGSGTSNGRVGKFVEKDGLSLLRWRSSDQELESSFRLQDPAEQHRFAAAIEELTGAVDQPTGTPQNSTDTTQEDA